jgi:hypothetical protein
MSEQALRGLYWAGVIVFALAIWVISLIHNWGASTWPQLGTAPLELKDVITIVVSTSAFLISAGVAVFNWWSWRQKNIEEAKKDCSFETCCHVPFPKFLKAGPLSVRPSRTDPATRMSSCTLRPMLQVYSPTLVVPENSIRRDSRGEADLKPPHRRDALFPS